MLTEFWDLGSITIAREINEVFHQHRYRILQKKNKPGLRQRLINLE
jgi:hypothetical protein